MRPRLKPVLAPLQVASLALGCVIGFGCFILAGDFLETAGPLGAALGITLGGLAMLVIARSYGLMVRTFPPSIPNPWRSSSWVVSHGS